MDGFTEKKWFVYLGDHHEGPFSLEEIQSKMGFGQLSTTNYVWAEGMADWVLMTEVQAFESIAPTQPEPALEATQVFKNGNGNGNGNGHGGGISIAPLSISPAEEAVASGPILSAVREEAPEEEPAPASAASKDLGDHKRNLVGQLIKLGFLFMVLGGLGYAYNSGYLSPLLQSETAKSLMQSAMNAADPILSKLGISSIPQLNDVDPEEYAGLKTAAQAQLEQAGPRIAIAVSKTDLLDPTFYVASNLPDGTILDIYLEGEPDTLLSQLSSSAKTEVVITKKFGKTGPLQFSEGRSLPRGQYTLYVVDPGTQPQAAVVALSRMQALPGGPKGLRSIATESYFLGGFRDATYALRLQEFHDQIKSKASQELTELKQIAMTLDSQLNETNGKFAALKRGRRPTAAQRKAWNAYNDGWTKMNQQFGELFSKLTPEALQKDYFYGPLYAMSRQTSDAVNQLHSIQAGYFAGAANASWDAKAFGIQLGESQAGAKSAVDLLKARIDQVEKTPPSPSGLPQKPGT